MLPTAPEKAQLLAKEAGVCLTVCFNPKDLVVEKSATWEPISPVDDEPEALFGPPAPASLSVTLLFDTYEEKVSVYKKYTSQLEKLIHILSEEVPRPPLVLFIWGGFSFAGVVESLSQKYTMFLSNGAPVRAECSLKMKKVRGAVSRRDSNPRSAPDKRPSFKPLWQG